MNDRFVVAERPGSRVVGLMTREQIVARLAAGALRPDHYCVPADATGDLSGRWRTLVEVFGHVPSAEPTLIGEPSAASDPIPVRPRLEPPAAAVPVLPRSVGVGDVLLTFGQFVSVLGCLAAVAYPWLVLAQLRETRVSLPPATGLSLFVGAAVAFGYSAAMFVVFSRAKLVRPR